MEYKTQITNIEHSLTYSQKQILQTIDRDIAMWQEKDWRDVLALNFANKKYKNKQQIKKDFALIVEYYERLKNTTKSYDSFDKNKQKQKPKKLNFIQKQSNTLALGYCPVSSPNTRCCNLYTLDAFASCSFGCSYCAIASFGDSKNIVYDQDFALKLKQLKLSPNKRYHIGTGQASDSLIYGNKFNVLDTLYDFAKNNKNIVLELKSKSNNISYLTNPKNTPPKNLLATWSLNPQIIIDNEESFTASLSQRIKSAREVANRGIKVGFHFHPIVYYDNYMQDYKDIFQTIMQTFSPDEVVTISFGTLTYTKPVLKHIRAQQMSSKILQMPFDSINKKFSYPLDIKKQIFAFAYNEFKPWHNKVYFYLCMEDLSLWDECFGYSYKNNNEMNKDMLDNYFSKMGLD